MKKNKEQLLIWAVGNNHVALVRELLGTADVDVHVKNDLPLQIAVDYNHIDIARMLLESGANAKNIHLPIAAEKVEIIRLLLEHGAESTPEALQLLAKNGDLWAKIAEGVAI